MYASIARGGMPVHLNDGVGPHIDTTGNEAPVLDPTAAWYVSSILRDIPPPVNGLSGRIAFKTGTSYGYRDAWAIGYDGKNVVGVWVGRPDGVPVPGISGIKAAAPILFEAFDRLGPTAPFATPPTGVIRAANPDLPEPLRRFRHPNDNRTARDPAPEISFPEDGSDLDLGTSAGDGQPLVVKVRNGAPPVHLLRQRRAVRASRVHPARPLAARRAGVRHRLGGGRQGAKRPGEGVSGLGWSLTQSCSLPETTRALPSLLCHKSTTAAGYARPTHREPEWAHTYCDASC